MYQNDPQKVLTGRCRLSYVQLTTPVAKSPGQDAKYSTTLLIPKSDIQTKADIDQSVEAAILEGIGKVWSGMRPPIIALPIYDGDGVRPSDGLPFGDECKGNWVMTASTKTKPQVVDVNGNDILLASDIYSGMYARVTFRFFPYNNNGRKGVGCGLGNVQKLADGEPLSGRSSAAEDFGTAAPQPAARRW